mgnify:CR=1 FL=1
MIKNSEHAYIEWKSKLELVMKEQYNITKQCDYAFGWCLFDTKSSPVKCQLYSRENLLLYFVSFAIQLYFYRQRKPINEVLCFVGVHLQR